MSDVVVAVLDWLLRDHELDWTACLQIPAVGLMPMHISAKIKQRS